MNSATTNIQRRRRTERYFVIAGAGAISLALLFLLILFADIGLRGWRGFLRAEVRLSVDMSPEVIGEKGEVSALVYQKLVKRALHDRFPESLSKDGNKRELRRQKKQIEKIAGLGGGEMLRDMVRQSPDIIGRRVTVWAPAGSMANAYLKGAADAEALVQRKIPLEHIARLDELLKSGDARTSFNWSFFSSADSRSAERAGIGGALRGSFFTLLLAFLFSFPAGVLAATYLELFAPRNRWFDFIEININNLAAVPSIIFGLLGLSVFINVFGMPRSSPLVGGLTLSLMTLPTIVITSRAAIKSAPPTLLAGALSLGATRMQGVFHHVLPAAMPGILTGSIIGMAQALGETAPLLMIGMVAFVAEAPKGITDAATALPVQIFLWADSPERGFEELTATAIIVLLGFLMTMNAAAIFLRQKLEVRW